MRARIDEGRCIGAGQCAFTVPEVFDQGDEGIALVIADQIEEGLTEGVRQAAAGCPAMAISVED
ncbi:ferredoxin [Streptomyces sp. NPDC050625]|uniref:ferredoxin n=1 Tax=Streptomyces sp. NPDC050625 TaxID=3154629 RepID=UPI00342172BA